MRALNIGGGPTSSAPLLVGPDRFKNMRKHKTEAERKELKLKKMNTLEVRVKNINVIRKMQFRNNGVILEFENARDC